MNFARVVKGTTKLARGLKKGLQALGTHSSKIEVENPSQLEGSVDIDNCLKQDYPRAPRWDYVFGYKNRIYYVEVHPAKSTGEVKKIIAKLEWLKEWRKNNATALEGLANSSSYHWIATKGVSGGKRSAPRRELVEHGIKGPEPRLKIP